MVSLARNNAQSLSYWTAEDAEAVRNQLDFTDAFSEALPFLTATLWWANYRRIEYEQVAKQPLWALRILIVGATLLAIFNSVLKLARYDLMPLLFGLWLSCSAGRYPPRTDAASGPYPSSLRSGWNRRGGLCRFLVVAWL